MEKSQISKGRSVWDCGSSLYDSYELNSFKRQLNTAIAISPLHKTTFSMSHLPQNCGGNKSFKISRTFQKLIRFVFKSNNKLRISNTKNTTTLLLAEKDRFCVVYDKSEPVLSTIPELPEFEVALLSPEITSLVKKSASERFIATTAIGINISCA